MINIKDMNEIVIGIDLGTTNSCCSIWRNKKLEIICDSENNKVIPSKIYLDSDKSLVGNEITSIEDLNPIYLYNDVKRLIGRKYTDPYVQDFKSFLSYQIINDEDDNILIPTFNRFRSPEELSSYILSKIKTITNVYLERENSNINAVITIPAYFNDAQRNATNNAAKIAGINCIRMINEPTAAALAYGILGNKNDEERNIIVYDLGGGTLDVSLLNIDEGVFEVQATTGDSYLGGEDFTQAIYKYCIQEFKKKNNIEDQQKIKIHQQKLKKLKILCEEAKIALSSIDSTKIHIERFWGMVDLEFVITQNKFQEICQPLLVRALEPVQQIMEISEHGLSKEDITDVLLVGGSTRIPVIQFMLHNFFNIKPTFSNNPDYIVASGAAIQGYLLSHNDNPFNNDIVLVDVIPLSLGIATSNGVYTPVIERNSTIPIKKTQKFTTDTDNETEIEIKVYEGERKLVKDNNLLAKFLLKDIEKAKKGIPVIEITFTVDVNGIINVTAKDVRSNSKKEITIINDKNKLTKNQIKQLVEEAEKLQKEDYEKKVNIEKKNELKEICLIITQNLDRDEIKIPNKEKEIIFQEIEGIIKNISELNNQHLLKKISILKKKYATLILDTNNEINNLESYQETNISFSNLNEDNDSSFYPEAKILNNDNDSVELNEEMDRLMAYINKLWKGMNQDKDKEFVDYLQKVIMWVNMTTDLTKLDIESKFKEVEINYQKYKTSSNFNNNYKIELEQLCSLLLNEISTKQLPLTNHFSDLLKNIIKQDILPWLTKTNLSDDDKQILQKIEFLNLKCQEFYDLSN